MKLPEYQEGNFEEQSLSCPHCHWQGKGADAIIIDFYGVAKTQEVHCPNCDENIAILKKDTGRPGQSPK